LKTAQLVIDVLCLDSIHRVILIDETEIVLESSHLKTGLPV
jgi:hypothetical protein